MSRKVKSVSFNLEDPFEQEMDEYSKRYSNFSSFVKRLIHAHMNGKSTPSSVEKSEFSYIPVEQPKIDKDLLRQLI